MRRREYDQGVASPHFRSAFFSPRSRFSPSFFRIVRVHPIILFIIFGLGVAFSRWLQADTLPTPVYQGDPFWEDDYTPFLPPDAPPLNNDDGESLAARRAKTRARLAALQGADRGDDSTENWDDEDSDAGDGGELSRPAYFSQLHGYLYYPTSAPFVSISIPKAVHPHIPRSPFDTLLDPPPIPEEGARIPPAAALRPPHPPWVHPETPFKNPDFLNPAAPPPAAPFVVAQAQAPGGGIWPARPGQNLPRYPLRPGAPGAALRGGPLPPPIRQAPPPLPVPPKPAKRLGANAAAMMRAEREGIPFKPAKPAELLEEQREYAQLAKLRRVQEEKIKAAKAAGDVKAVAEAVPPAVWAEEQQQLQKKQRNAALVDRRNEAKRRKDLEDLYGVGAAQPAVQQPVQRPKPIVGAPPVKPKQQPAPLPPPPKVFPPEDVVPEKKKKIPALQLFAPDELSPDSVLEIEDLGEDDENEDFLALTPEERADEDEELRQLFTEMTEEEKQMLTPEELKVFESLMGEPAIEEKKVVVEEWAQPDPPPVVAEKPKNIPAPVVKLDKKKKKANLDARRKGKEAAGGGRRRMKRSFGDGEDEVLPHPDLEAPPPELVMESDLDAVLDLDEPDEMVDVKERILMERADEGAPQATKKDRIHPISYLVKEAEEEWNSLLQRQSQTLFQAVVEYQRRYKRKPPLGFDSWWRYAMENKVILVDEYDQIDDDIKPFFSLPASEVRARAFSLATDRLMPQYADSFTLRIKDGSISATGPQSGSAKSEDTQDLMSEFTATLPDMGITFASHSLPSIAISGEARKRHQHYAEHGTLLTPLQSIEVLENKAYLPWQGLCPPNSTARRVADGLGSLTPRPSFVSTSHVPAMDFCHHPEVQPLNGFTAWRGPRPYLLYPLFSSSKTSMHGDIVYPSLDHTLDKTMTITKWTAKAVNRVLWRGETTGTFYQHGSGWRTSQRSRLALLTSDVEGEREVRYADSNSADAMRRFRGPTADINEFYFDVGFAGSPKQCNELDETCRLITRELKFFPAMNKDRFGAYKYIIDVDGNGPSTDFHRHLASGSVVLKSTIFTEWYTKRIMPWFHYIPIKTDYTDLHDVAAFFIGTPDGEGSHDNLAQKIGENGKSFAKQHWRDVDMAAYQFRLYLEYARLLSREEEGSHDFVME